MIIKEALAQLVAQQKGPVVKILEKGEHFKVIVLAFKKGMELKAHQTPIPACLLVMEGSVVYQEESRTINLAKFDDFSIPVNVLHSVNALEDSTCLLIQG